MTRVTFLRFPFPLRPCPSSVASAEALGSPAVSATVRTLSGSLSGALFALTTVAVSFCLSSAVSAISASALSLPPTFSAISLSVVSFPSVTLSLSSSLSSKTAPASEALVASTLLSLSSSPSTITLSLTPTAATAALDSFSFSTGLAWLASFADSSLFSISFLLPESLLPESLFLFSLFSFFAPSPAVASVVCSFAAFVTLSPSF
mmetsp:Transcript_5530/g.21238  ORF Transcript_5530/g.21238 Transcript_5530/m.21238 type:complete len:205 (-) Transcript_5530:1660-2274(-)